MSFHRLVTEQSSTKRAADIAVVKGMGKVFVVQ